MKYWEIDKENTEKTWLSLKDKVFEEYNAWPQWNVSIRWDECSNLFSSMPDDEALDQRWHICGLEGIDELIGRLQEMRALALAHFKGHQKDFWEEKDNV